jgi:L-iditol 2-dehydrogenase
MRAVILESLEHLRVVETPVPRVEPGKVLIRISLCGICGTDFLMYDGRSPVEFPYRSLGHEYVGTVAEAGEGVRTLTAGDRVVIDPNYHCDSCYYCQRGETGFCENRRAFATKSNGGFAEYSCVAEKHAQLIPPAVSDEQAIFAEPLSCCLHAFERIGLRPGEDLLIYGCGTMGLLMLQLCRRGGAGRIVASDPVAIRREAALRLGADRAVDPGTEDLAAVVSSAMPRGPGVVVESAGARNTIAEAVGLAARRGRVLLLATWGDGAQAGFDPELVVRKEVSLIGTIFGTGALSRAVSLLASRQVVTDSLLTRVYGLDDIGEAMRVAMGRGAIKVAVRTG